MTASVGYALRKLAGQPGRVLQNLKIRARTIASWDRLYASIREPKRSGALPMDDAVARTVVTQLRAEGLSVERRSVEPGAYRDYLASADYARFPLYMDGGRAAGFHEKGLEHFLAARLSGLRRGETCIDVASQNSPVPELYARLFGAEMFEQDLSFPRGLSGRRIGGDAAAMPVPDAFADVLVLHNAFEHFEGDSDIRFVHEAARVLKDGGRVCILPLFMHDRFANQTDPAAIFGTPPAFDPGAEVWCVRGWHDRFGRHYDAARLKSRLLAHAGAFDVQLMEFVDAGSIDALCYLRFAIVLRKR